MEAKSLDESFEIISIIANKISSSMSTEQLATSVQEFLETFMRVEYNGLYFYDEKSKRLKLIYAKNFSKKEKNEAEKTAMDRHPGLVFRTRKHLLIKDTTKSKDSSSSKRSFKILSRLYIPLVIEDKCVGTFGLASSIKNNFSEYDIKILSVVGAMAAMRIITINKEEENKEHLKKNLKLIRSLNIVNTFADVIHESNTIDDVVWSITQNAISELGYSDCVVYLLDEAGEYLIQRAAYGNKNPNARAILNPIKIKVGDGIVGSVAITKKGEVIPDTSKDKRYILDDILRLSEIAVPIVHSNNIIGVIDSEHSEKNFFPEEHLELLNTIALMTATKLIQIRYDNNLLEYHNKLESLVEERTYKLNETTNQLKEQRISTIDSLNYALRIQQSILPELSIFEGVYSDYFIYYKPKDIVSGDFYWSKKIGKKHLFALCDCTGHGVPGALMSIIGHDALNNIVKYVKVENIADILLSLNRYFYDFHQNKKNSEKVVDTMDVTLICYDIEKQAIKYTGCKHKFYHIRNNKIQEYKTDTHVLGSEIENISFNFNEIKVQTGDVFYLYSDGFPDQFGGEKGKKFKYNRFKELLLSINHMTMQEQKIQLNETLTNWQNGKYKYFEQIDDISIVGLKI